MKSKLCIALLWILVFLLGGIAGAVSYHLYHQHVKPTPEEFVKELAQDLKLDAQQTKSLEAIFDESLKRYRALSKETKPQFRAIRNETDEKIRGILRPDQKIRFEERLKKFRKPEPSQPSPLPASSEAYINLIEHLSPSVYSQPVKKENMIMDPPMLSSLPAPSQSH
jgi:uncharacterized membrane protein